MDIDTFHEVWTLLDIIQKAHACGPAYAWFGQQAHIGLLNIKDLDGAVPPPTEPPPPPEPAIPPRAIPSTRDTYEGLPGPAEGSDR